MLLQGIDSKTWPAKHLVQKPAQCQSNWSSLKPTVCMCYPAKSCSGSPGIDVIQWCLVYVSPKNSLLSGNEHKTWTALTVVRRVSKASRQMYVELRQGASVQGITFGCSNLPGLISLHVGVVGLLCHSQSANKHNENKCIANRSCFFKSFSCFFTNRMSAGVEEIDGVIRILRIRTIVLKVRTAALAFFRGTTSAHDLIDLHKMLRGWSNGSGVLLVCC